MSLKFSIEFFPPKTEKGRTLLDERIKRILSQYKPEFIDLTWPVNTPLASHPTPALALELQERYSIPVNMHLTCSTIPIQIIDETLQFCQENGIKRLMALRGDPPAKDIEEKVEGLGSALELVQQIHRGFGDSAFELSVSGYPEGHPDKIGEDDRCSSQDFAEEIAYLKKKVDAGNVRYIITQLFFDVQLFFAFVKACRDAGIEQEILPGIMLLTSYEGFIRMTGFCKTSVPNQMRNELEEIKGDAKKVDEYAVELAVKMCKDLVEGGVEHLHFYTLNQDRVLLPVLDQVLNAA